MKKNEELHDETTQVDNEEIQKDEVEVEAEVIDEMPESESDATDTVAEAELVKQALIEAEKQAKENADKYQRTIAEFDNFRKRTIKEKAAMYDSGAKEVLENLLPVIDNFERALEHISEEEKDLGITKGIEMIYKQLMDTMTELGVKEIDALHQEFDPNLHHAVTHEENDAYDDNLVAEVFQKGYMYKETVLRYSMVKVVN
ncbi:nucleotide exchange factor GrpE [Vallitaleaceae bacterium 9-2]